MYSVCMRRHYCSARTELRHVWTCVVVPKLGMGRGRRGVGGGGEGM